MNISILAGNTRIEHSYDLLTIDPQLIAFEAAMKKVAEVRENIAKVAVAIDHKGDPQGLLDPSLRLSRGQRKSPRLAYLHPKLRESYVVAAERYNVALEDIHMIMEQHAYSDIRRLTSNPCFYHFSEQACDDKECGDSKIIVDPVKARVNCQGVTAAIIRRLGLPLGKEGSIYTFWEQRLRWTDPIVITGGTKLAMEILGVRAAVVQTMFRPARHGGIIKPAVTEFWYDEDRKEVEMA